MTITRTRSRRRVLSVWTAGAVLTAAMLGHVVISAPPAWANCTMTPQDDQYVQLLAKNKMIHTADFNDCNVVAEGRWFADQVRNSPDPLGKARSLMKLVTDTTPMNADQAEWEVECAIFCYAPEMIPQIKDEKAHEPPAA
jgi:hypothetical protein